MTIVKTCIFGTVRALVVAAMLPFNASFAPDAHAQAATSPEAEILQSAAIILPDGRTHLFQIEVADTAAERRVGLMFREELAPDAGMLFIFPDSQPRAFWMRNTLVSLDILYFDEFGRLVSIQANAIPLDETALPSAGPARYVLEINGGLAAELGIGFGARLRSDALEQEGLGLPDN